MFVRAGNKRSISKILTANFHKEFPRGYRQTQTYYHRKQGRNVKMTDVKEDLSEQLSKLHLQAPEFIEGSYPEYNVVDLCRNYIAGQLSKLTGVDKKIAYDSLAWSIVLEKGDLIVPLPRLRLKGDLVQMAKDLAAKFELGGFLDHVAPVGKFLQFFFSPKFLLNVVTPDVLKRGAKYGSAPLGKGKTVLVEYSSPNIAKPFHAGHLRSTIIGGFLSNLYERLGWKVIRMNYLGDWGKQFGVLAVGFNKYGSDEELAKNPIQHLFEVYVKINQDIASEKEEAEKTGVPLDEKTSTDGQARAFFKRMEQGDKEALKLWKKFRELSISKYIGTYGRLNIKYDVYSGESQVSQKTMDMVMEQLHEKKLIHEDKGALLVDFKKLGKKKLGKVLVQKTDGTSLYVTRDLGAAIERKNKYNFDKMIYVIASQQDLHVKQFFTTLKMMGYKWADDLIHVNFGMVLGMSTRKGTVVFLDDILENVQERMLEIMQKNKEKFAQVEDPKEVADQIGISAVMIQDMQAKRINNYEFGWDRMLSSEGDTGPYLQYAHSRLRSIERNCNIPPEDVLKADMSLDNICGTEEQIKKQNLDKEEEEKQLKNLALRIEKVTALIRIMASYPDTLRYASKNHEPSTIVTYLFKLTHQFSSTYKVLRVMGEPREILLARLALFSSVRQILNNGMRVLGITPVERM